jgi:hypothetical protein
MVSSNSQSAKTIAAFFSAELEGNWFHCRGHGSHDGSARARFAGEGDAIDFRVRCEKFARGTGSESMHEIEDSRRDAGCLHHFRQ